MSGIFKRTRLPRYGAKAVYTNSSGKPAAVSLNIQGTDETKTSTYSIKITDESPTNVTEAVLKTEAQINPNVVYPDTSVVYGMVTSSDGNLSDIVYADKNFIDPVGITLSGVGSNGTESSKRCYYDNTKNVKNFYCDTQWTSGQRCHNCVFAVQFENSKSLENVNWSLDSVKKHMAAVKRPTGYMKVKGCPYHCHYEMKFLKTITKENHFSLKDDPTPLSDANSPSDGGCLCNWAKKTCCIGGTPGFSTSTDHWSTSAHSIAWHIPGTNIYEVSVTAKFYEPSNDTWLYPSSLCMCWGTGPNDLLRYGTCYSYTSQFNGNFGSYACCPNTKCCGSRPLHPSQKHTFTGCDIHMWAEAMHCEANTSASSACTAVNVFSSYLTSTGLDCINCYQRSCCRLHQAFRAGKGSCCHWFTNWQSENSIKWLQYDPVSGKNIMMLVGKDSGFWAVDAAAWAKPVCMASMTCASCCQKVDGMTYGGIQGFSGEHFTKLGELPSNDYGSFNSIYDYPEHPYQIDDECWISFRMCCTYNATWNTASSETWNGCYLKYASPDLINWVDITEESGGALSTAMAKGVECIHTSYKLGNSELQRVSNNFFKEDILSPDGLIEIKVDANRYERSGLVVPPGDSIYITDISGEDSVVQVWGYED
jgi:hypothetical protein